MILDKRRLNAMVDYCKTTGCLREYILKYFGERPDNPEGGRYNCHNCSNCVVDEAEQEADEAYMYPGNRFSAPVSRNAAMVADRMKRSAAAANQHMQHLSQRSRRMHLMTEVLCCLTDCVS